MPGRDVPPPPWPASPSAPDSAPSFPSDTGSVHGTAQSLPDGGLPDGGGAVVGDRYSGVDADRTAAGGARAVSSSQPPASGGGQLTGFGQRPASDRRRRRAAKKNRLPWWAETGLLFVVALVIAVVVHTFFFQAFYIPSGSMENTLHVGDRVIVNLLSYKVGHVQRGQIIVFNGEDSWTPEVSTATPSNPVARVIRDIGGFLGFAPPGERDFIKRVIGVPGDHIQCCDAVGHLLVNGVPLQENYLSSGEPAQPATTQVNLSGPGSRFDIVVPPGRVWVEGDHRDNSADSRAHRGDPGGGTIPESKIIGRAFVVVWPPSHWRLLSIPPGYHAIPNAAAVAAGEVRPMPSALPLAIGVLAVTPVGVLRLRRRRAHLRVNRRGRR